MAGFDKGWPAAVRWGRGLQMIVSVSRRTDIPAHYSEWFVSRVRDGFALVPNPRNTKQVRRVSLLPSDVDGFVFWTKNPAPMLPYLRALEAYAYYFQVTVTPYGRDVEPGIPDQDETVIPAVRKLSEAIGPARVLWRYDPILLSKRYSMEFHYEAFARMAAGLSGHVARCTISFLDMYRNTARNAGELGLNPIGEADMLEMAEAFAGIAKAHGIPLAACAEPLDFSRFGIARAACIDPAILSKVSGRPIHAARDRNQRLECGCAKSVDIGAYNTCGSSCKYCYANFSPALIRANLARHNPGSASLTGIAGG